MNVSEFIAKWEKSELTERSAAQQHFLDLCELLGHPKPAAVDPTGESFTFEKGAAKQGGGDGFADVWKKGFFAWEYKGKHKDLAAAYNQLLNTAKRWRTRRCSSSATWTASRSTPNFTNTPVRVYDIPLSELGEPRNLEIIRARLLRSRQAQARRDERGDHRACRRAPRRNRPEHARARARPAPGRAVPRPHRLLPFRGGRRTSAEKPVQPACPKDAG